MRVGGNLPEPPGTWSLVKEGWVFRRSWSALPLSFLRLRFLSPDEDKIVRFFGFCEPMAQTGASCYYPQKVKGEHLWRLRVCTHPGRGEGEMSFPKCISSAASSLYRVGKKKKRETFALRSLFGQSVLEGRLHFSFFLGRKHDEARGRNCLVGRTWGRANGVSGKGCAQPFGRAGLRGEARSVGWKGSGSREAVQGAWAMSR